MTEQLWLVDEHDNPIGAGMQERSYIPRQNWQNFRSVYGFIRNSEGKLWLPFRSAHKPIFASMFDASISGHVTYPESYEVAFRREVLEEVGIDIDRVKTEYLCYLSPFALELSSWMKVWEIRTDVVPHWNKNDFSHVDWLSPDEFRDAINIGAQAKPDVLKLINSLYPATEDA